MEIDHSTLGIVDEAPDTAATEAADIDSTAEATSEPTAPVPEVPAQAAETIQESAPPQFEFGGRSWNTREEAEHAFKSWEGRIRAEQDKSKDYESRLNQYWDYVQAVSKENQEFRNQLTKPEPKAEEPEKGIDFARIQNMMELARNQGYDPLTVGIRAYAQQAEERFAKVLEEKVKEVRAPLQSMQEQEQERVADKNMFLWAQSQKLNDGSPTYPELQADNLDENLTVSLHRVWKQLAKTYGPEYGYSPHAFDYAFRLAKDLTHRPPADKPRDDQGRFIPARADAASSSEVTGSQPNPVRPAKTKHQEMLEELAAIKPVKIGETDLGFYE